MSECVGEIILGSADEYGCGMFSFEHRISVIWGDAMALVLEQKPREDRPGELLAKWIPIGPDYAVETLVLMMEIFEFQNKQLKQELESIRIMNPHYCSLNDDTYWYMCEKTVDIESLKRLFEEAKKSINKRCENNNFKVIISVFGSLGFPVEKLLDYTFRLEVCRTVFVKGKKDCIGKLPGKERWDEYNRN